MTACLHALYASKITIAKYLGRKNGGDVVLILSNRSLNQVAGRDKFGNVFDALHFLSAECKKSQVECTDVRSRATM